MICFLVQHIFLIKEHNRVKLISELVFYPILYTAATCAISTIRMFDIRRQFGMYVNQSVVSRYTLTYHHGHSK